ncbi:hypothetical protein HLPR_26450 [Helicovermis profundi]|uniref:Uncharacterized protein n=1 Tax=Helicovermis profundi TaxID=3065157 RepID=A0AAU9EQ69_9FIRM|nr:hypothetical protein HLPR_26450 [Clostridia bacterium S502]
MFIFGESYITSGYGRIYCNLKLRVKLRVPGKPPKKEGTGIPGTLSTSKTNPKHF